MRKPQQQTTLRPEDVRSLTDFKRNTVAQLKELKKTGRPRLLTTNGRAQVVVQDAAAYQRLLDELDAAKAVVGIQRGRDDMAAGRTMSSDEAFDSIRRKKRMRRAAIPSPRRRSRSLATSAT